MVDQVLNESGLPVGFAVPDWQARARPPLTAMDGEQCQLVPLDIDKHIDDLFESFSSNTDHTNWTYLPYGPFAQVDECRQWMEQACTGEDPMFHTVIERSTGKAVGVASYLRIEPAVGVIEVGHIHFSPLIQRTVVSTEAMYLMMKRVFDELGYRRYEWKCDALNQPSRKTAERLGFQFEGIFRQATLYKGRNRDTAWFSIIDSEWPRIRAEFERWLSVDNFDGQGVQRVRLGARAG